jgi:nicotinamidase-related amidase
LVPDWLHRDGAMIAAQGRLDKGRLGEDDMKVLQAFCLAGVVALTLATGIAPAGAQTLIEEWNTAKIPPPPTLKAVKIVPKETALLVMDFTRQTCSQQRRPRCAASVPKVAKLVNEARGKGALIIYSVAVPKSVPGDILKDLTPAAGEEVLPPLGPDKFINSNLEQTLKSKGITTVVAMGTQAQTSVLHTGGEAALRGFKVIVPVDGMSADDVFPELYTAWHLSTASRISSKVTLTKFDMMGF